MHHSQLFCSALILLLSSIVSTIASAGEGEGGANAREQCRIQVSGAYLGYMNDLDQLKGTLARTSESTFAMKAKNKLTARELAAANAHNEAQKTPAAELDEKVLGLRYTLETTDDEIREAEVSIATIKEQIATKEKAFLKFKDASKLVFETVTAKVVNTGGYPIRLQYRHPCSQYQQVCSLPKPHAAALIKLADELDDKTACERYANIRGDDL